MLERSGNHKLSLFSVIMINVMAVDSLRTLPLSAQYGYALVFFYLLAAFVFFIPSALATAELASQYPQTGGAYVWIKYAFGPRWAFVSIWLQWFYNVCWYPTIIALVSATMAYLVDPALANNKVYMVGTMISMYALLTGINCFGLRFSSHITNLAAILGTLLPMFLIIILGILWLALGKPLAIPMTTTAFLPDISHMSQLVLLTAILYGLVGIDMSAIHAEDVIEPEKIFPKALWISVVIILLTLTLSSLAIALVVPPKSLNLITGLLQAFSLFFEGFHMKWIMPYIAMSIVLGALGSVIAWIIGPAKGLMIACQDGCLPAWLAKQNRHEVPHYLLILQFIIFVLLTLIFILLPSVNAAFWLLTDITAQLALLSYIFLFAALIKLDRTRQDKPRQIPGKQYGVYCVGGLGILASSFAVLLGFIPPTHLEVGSLFQYELIVCLGLFLGLVLPLILFRVFKQE